MENYSGRRKSNLIIVRIIYYVMRYLGNIINRIYENGSGNIFFRESVFGGKIWGLKGLVRCKIEKYKVKGVKVSCFCF